ncbi:bifunctional glutamate N-acetyltransferase/amino-acid acetyltransferase ArgJ [Candidatus Binatia bacterium]|nr:bifunctional glutamate N-acetyltransferase/amino-acid acetyltransferase ArgJ [Candidatus Binatia bacterium]
MKLDVAPIPVRVAGFRFAGATCGLKAGGARDVAVIASAVPATAAAAFTTNRVQAAPVVVGRPRAASGRLQAIVVNSGNANAYTGRDGLATARAMCKTAARALGISEALVLPSSTGRIGVAPPRDRLCDGVAAACAALSTHGFHDALAGIMTTDAFPKFAVEGLVVGEREVTLAGMAKGAGMIAPRLALANRTVHPHATTLAYVFTDAAVSVAALRRVLAAALPQSFNAIVVDGDTSTNDTIVLLANGLAGNTPITVASAEFPAFCGAAVRVLRTLARQIVKDGEGATRVVDVRIHGARTRRDAERVADTIARSPLCKAAFFGGDPYTGRIVCAAGYSGAHFDPDRLDVFLDDVQVVRAGRETVGRIEARAAAVVQRPEFTLTLHLHAGNATAHRMMSDLTVDYVRFNSDYRT